MAIDKDIIQSVFSQYYVVDPPKNILVLDKPTVAFEGQKMVMFRGLQPKWRGDVIIITPQGDDETLLHESLHAQYHAGELLASVGGKVLVVKHRMMNRRPMFRQLFNIITPKRNVVYQRVNNDKFTHDLYKQFMITMPPDAHPIHYQLVST